MKRILSVLFALPLLAVSAVPVVSDCVMTQSKATREVTITYRLSATPAVVTIDIETNVTDDVWVSIGGSIVGASLTGDVFKRITEPKDVYAVGWKPVETWPNIKIKDKGIRAVVKAYAVDDTPDYMVVDLAAESAARVRYYPSVDFLPGGLFGDNAYRETKMVMRKVTAKDIPWTMGSTWEYANQTTTLPANKYAHEVTLTNNYYLGVFEVTHKQWLTILGSLPAVVDGCRFDTNSDRRPVEQATPSKVRGAHNWPTPPTADSLLGQMRTRTICDEFPFGVDFDLPSEAEWEFACRSDSVDGEWNTRTRFTSSSLWAYFDKGTSTAQKCYAADAPGRYAMNGGYVYDAAANRYAGPNPVAECGLENGTAEVGSVFSPNSWGFYDMHGNVSEMCLDYYTTDITGLNGRVQNDSSRASLDNNKLCCVCRGGSYNSLNASEMLSSTRRTQVCTGSYNTEKYVYGNGLRVACRAGLK